MIPCLHCFAEARDEARRCPSCGRELAAQREPSYFEKLLQALHHPRADIQLRAIVALGLRREADAIEPLIACALDQPLDVVLGIEVARALHRIGQAHPTLDPLGELARRHPSEIVLHAIDALQSPLPICPYRGQENTQGFPCGAAEGTPVSAADCQSCAIPEAIAHPRACLFLLPVRHRGESQFICRCYSTSGSILSADQWRRLCFCSFWFPRPKIERELEIPGIHGARTHALAILRGEIKGELRHPPTRQEEPCDQPTALGRWWCRQKKWWQAWRI